MDEIAGKAREELKAFLSPYILGTSSVAGVIAAIRSNCPEHIQVGGEAHLLDETYLISPFSIALTRLYGGECVIAFPLSELIEEIRQSWQLPLFSV